MNQSFLSALLDFVDFLSGLFCITLGITVGILAIVNNPVEARPPLDTGNALTYVLLAAVLVCGPLIRLVRLALREFPIR